MSNLYSFKGQYPRGLPFRIITSRGTTRTDPTTFTYEDLLDAGYSLVENPPVVNSSNEKLKWDSESFSWQVVLKTKEELEIETESISASVREYRNKLLNQSDWTQVLDAPVDRERWAVYRQSLRDITRSLNFPDSVEWPVPPNKE
jgi:hypothetical protein